MNLDEMIQQCALDVDETPLNKTGGTYTGDALEIATKFVAGINRAYQRICRERYRLVISESITLDSTDSFDVTELSKTCVEIQSIDSAPNYGIGWVRRFGNTIIVPGLKSGDSVTVNYSYLPDKLTITDLNGEPLLPESKVDHRILCYYADFEYLKTQVDPISRNRADTWLALYNDGYENIVENFGEIRQIQATYDPGW